MCRSPNYNTVLKQIISPILWKLVKQILVLVDYTHLFLRTLNAKDKWEREKEDGRRYFAIDSEIICISHFGLVVTCTTRGHDMYWWSFPQRKKSPFPSAHLLQLGQWKSHQGCKSRTMELFALHRQWMIVTWIQCCSVALVGALGVKLALRHILAGTSTQRMKYCIVGTSNASHTKV